jgi:hypothetical protein
VKPDVERKPKVYGDDDEEIIEPEGLSRLARCDFSDTLEAGFVL